MKRADILRLMDEGYDDDEIEALLAEKEQRDTRERKQRKQEKQAQRRKPKREES